MDKITVDVLFDLLYPTAGETLFERLRFKLRQFSNLRGHITLEIVLCLHYRTAWGGYPMVLDSKYKRKPILLNFVDHIIAETLLHLYYKIRV